MKPKRAYTLAINALRAEIQKYAVDANMHDLYGANYSHAVNASKRKKELEEAIEVLEKEQVISGKPAQLKLFLGGNQ